MINRVGNKHGRLTVVSLSPYRGKKGKEIYWVCRCGCGILRVVRADGLSTGHAKSCGCLKKDAALAVVEEYSVTHGMSRRDEHNRLSPEYAAYQRAKDRCTNPKHVAWANYGGRGIKFLFTSFEQFFAELGFRPKDKTLDRFPNNNGNYEPGNVRWATRSEQEANKRRKGNQWGTTNHVATSARQSPNGQRQQGSEYRGSTTE